MSVLGLDVKLFNWVLLDVRRNFSIQNILFLIAVSTNLKIEIYCHLWGGFAWLILMVSGLDNWIYWHFFIIKINWNSSRSMSKTRSILFWTTSVSSFTGIDWVLIYESVTSSTATALNDDCLTNEPFGFKMKVGVILRLAVYRQSVHLGTEPLETHGHIFSLNLTRVVIVLM
jgi:hypothetical protein